MFVTNPFKARAVFFYFCMFHKLRLGYAGIHDDSRETDDSDISWQEFDNNSTTTNEQVILCANITVGLDSITCPNATIAILKVIKKVQEDSGDVDESDKDSIRDTLLAYCNGGEHCSGTPLGDIEDECGDDGTTSTYVEFRVEYLCIEVEELPASTTTQTSSTTTISPTSSVKDAGVSRTLPQPPKDKFMRKVYIGVGAGVGGLLLLLILLAAIILLLRKRRPRESSPQTTGEQYSQPMKKRKKPDNKSRRTDRNHNNKERGHQSNQSTNSVNSDAPPPVPLFMGIEKTNAKEGEIKVNMIPTALKENPKVESGKRKHRTPKGKGEKKNENHEYAEYDSSAKSSDHQRRKHDEGKPEYEYSYADRYRPTEIMKKVMKNPPKLTPSDKGYSGSAAGSNFAYDYADPVHDV